MLYIKVTRDEKDDLVKRFALTSILAFIGCSPANPGSEPKDSGLTRSDVKLTISLTHNDSKPEWTASFHFDKPVEAYVFATPIPDRETKWTIKDSETVEFVPEQNGRLIAAKDGSKFQNVTFDFNSFESAEDVAPFMFFSEGSVAVFTTMFTGYEYRSAPEAMLDLTTVFKLTPRSNESAVTDVGMSSQTLE